MDTPTEVNILPYDWKGSDRNGSYQIRVWGHQRDDQGQISRVLLRLDDYQPTIRVELPISVNGNIISWSSATLSIYLQWLRGELGIHQPIKVVFKELMKVGCGDSKFPFLVCSFSTEEAMKHCIETLKRMSCQIRGIGSIKSWVCETQISILHRLVTEVNIDYCQWFTVKVNSKLIKISRCEHEYLASYRDIVPLSPDQTKDWIVNPKIAAIGIQCYSRDHKIPNPCLIHDVVFQIAYVVQELGQRKKYLLSTKPCAEIPDVTIVYFQDEAQMIDGLCELIKETDPCIITGYNITYFHLKYLDGRLKLHSKEWKNCGSLIESSVQVRVKEVGLLHPEPMKFRFHLLECEGRLCLDMLPIIRQTFKLDKYTLDHVANHFLGYGRLNVIPSQLIFEMYQKACLADDISQRISNGTSKLLNKVGANIVYKDSDSIFLDMGTDHDISEEIADKLSSLYSNEKDLLAESEQNMTQIGKSCLDSPCLSIDLMEKLRTWDTLIRMSSICQMEDHYTSIQQRKILNQIYRTGFVVDGEKRKFHGGYVAQPVPVKFEVILPGFN